MNRSQYLASPPVRDFIDWAMPLVTGEWGLTQSWSSSRPTPVSFSCNSLYEAYEKYEWDDLGLDDTVSHLDGSKTVLRDTTSRAVPTDEDNKRFLAAAKEVVRWGGIRWLESSLDDLGADALERFKANARLLDPESADTDNMNMITLIGSGYSKIYACILNDFPIYDSRVACALTYLIWLFCRDKALDEVPIQLRLGVPADIGDKGRRPRGFPNATSSPRLYAESNLKAAWLLGELSRHGPFDALPSERRVMAIQSALFMIGYEPLTEDSIRKA